MSAPILSEIHEPMLRGAVVIGVASGVTGGTIAQSHGTHCGALASLRAVCYGGAA